ncbi:MAG: lipopolysaccharide biosynthesis protein [Planctomycetes bacterium]|nr:lipopolysaccharide biosynthesis protein [Planctomycetota bacterium]
MAVDASEPAPGGGLARLLKHALIYGGGDTLVRIVNFLLLPVFTAYLTPADYGISSILGVLTFLVVSLFSLGLGAAVGPCYFERPERDHRDRTIWTACAVLALAGGLVTAAGWTFARELSRLAFLTDAHADLVRLTLLTAALSLVAQPLDLLLRFEERAKTATALSVLSALLNIGAALALVVGAGRGVRGLVEAWLLARVAMTGLYLGAALAYARPGVRASTARELLRLGLPLVPAFACTFVLQQAGKYLLQWFSGGDELGVYQVGYTLGMALSFVVSAFQSAWYPFFMSYRERPTEAARLCAQVMRGYVAGVGGLTVAFFIWAHPVVELLTRPAFAAAHRAVGLAAASQFAYGIFLVLLPPVYYAKELRVVTGVQAAAAAASLALGAALVPACGLVGAGLAATLGHALMAVLQQLWNRRRAHYLKVAHDGRQVGGLLLGYAAWAGVTLIERRLSLRLDMLWATAQTVVLAAVMWRLLGAEAAAWRHAQPDVREAGHAATHPGPAAAAPLPPPPVVASISGAAS